MKRIGLVLVFFVVASGVMLIRPIFAQSGTIIRGGAVSGRWTLAGSPYILQGNISTGDKVSLKIDPGVVVQGNNHLFIVNGPLYIAGNETQRVVLNDVRLEAFKTRTPDEDRGQASINFATVNGGTIYSMTEGRATLNLADSLLYDIPTIYLRRPLFDSTIQRNIFRRTGGIKGTGQVDLPGPRYALVVQNNVFVDGTPGTYAVDMTLGPIPAVDLNSFYDTDREVVHVGTDFGATIDLTANYWNTTDPEIIARMIRERTESGRLGVAEFEPFLTVPDFETPQIDEPVPTMPATSTTTGTPTATASATPTRTPFSTRTPFPTRTPTSTNTSTPTRTGTATRTPTVTITPSRTRTVLATQTTTRTATPSITPSATRTRITEPPARRYVYLPLVQKPFPTPTATNTPIPTSTPTPTSTSTSTATPENTPTVTNTPEPTNTAPPTNTPEPPFTPFSCSDNPRRAPNSPVRITRIDKGAEVVYLRNVSGAPINLDGWTMCSITGGQAHNGIGGTLAPGATQGYGHGGGSIWNNNESDPGALYDRYGRLVSYLGD